MTTPDETATGNVQPEDEPVAVWQRRPSRFAITIGSRAFPLDAPETVIGRAQSATIIIDSLAVSRSHALLTVDGERVTVEDAGSKNGTYVDGVRLDTRVEIADGAQIQVGPIWLTLRALPEER
jgi:pSer/pThr/pTyr-binding forkhead associated (FHA) protein